MTFLALPWLEMAVGLVVLGSISVHFFRDPARAYQLTLWITSTAFCATFLAWLAFYLGTPLEEISRLSLQRFLFGRLVFKLDELSSPLVPSVALMHFLTALATARNHLRRFSFSWSMGSEAIKLLMFACTDPWILIALLSVATLVPILEFKNRGRPLRVYIVHMSAFVGLLILGWSLVTISGSTHSIAPWWAALPLLLAILIRCGTVPAHCWLTDWFEHASPGIGLLFVLPLGSVYAAVRLVLPISPGWVLASIGLLSLFTAVYAAGMSIIQTDPRRFFAFLFLSHSSLVLVGLEIHSELSLTGSFCLWFSAILSLGGFGLTLRALEARFGRLSLMRFHGLYEHSPTLAVCFLLTGLGAVGFPFTLGFISTEILVDSAVEAGPYLGFSVVTAAALNGISVLRVYFRFFTGARHHSTMSLALTFSERVAVLTLAALILGGGIFPQPGVTSRERAAAEIRTLRQHNGAKDENVGHGARQHAEYSHDPASRVEPIQSSSPNKG